MSEDGKLVCEDVHDIDFFREMCKVGNCYGIDGTANASIRVQHMERILIKDEKDCQPPRVAEFVEYTPPAKKRFFVLDVPYAHGG